MDAHQLSALDDAEYEQIAKENAHPPARDPEVWAALTHPINIARTREAYTGMLERTAVTLRNRKVERDAFQQECFARGEAGKQEWFASRTEYDRWRRRAGNFHQTMQKAIADVGRAQKTINRSVNHQLAQHHRERLRELATAISRHQAQHARSGAIAEQCDYELWRLLDQLTIPLGPADEPTTLRTMLDIYWPDVEPVSAQRAAEEQAETAMRQAPGGRSAHYSGVPRARHVNNGKRLA
ncbi:hypothetical protein AB0H07_46800 [Streptomyces sp. NPDC021354]|uniref:hypothetical protein n=1 Tax=Streptomyces sp. NPDC021354 TaxID=3154793 RepID=UPI0033F24081